MSFPTDRVLGANDFVCNCTRIRDDRDDDRFRRRFICREVEELGIDGRRRLRFVCTEIRSGSTLGTDIFF